MSHNWRDDSNFKEDYKKTIKITKKVSTIQKKDLKDQITIEEITIKKEDTMVIIVSEDLVR